MKRDILHFRINSLFASVEQNKCPGLRGKPVVVAAPKGKSGGIVVSASKEARRLGVIKDMSIRQAQRTCPDGVILKADYASYKLHFNAFLDIAARYSPLLEPDSLESAFLDVSGCSRLFGSASETADAIAKETSKTLNLNLSIGHASNKLLAKFASATAKRFTSVETGTEDVFLAPIAVSELDAVDPKTNKRLQELGVSTIGQLANVSEASLLRQFGPVGSAIKKQSQGIDYTPVTALYPSEIIIIEHVFCWLVNEPVQILEILPKLADDLSANLKKKDKLAGSIALTLFDDTRNIESAEYGTYCFKRPNDSAHTILDSLAKILDSMMTPSMEISKVEVTLSNLGRGSESQLCLIGNGERNRRLKVTLDAISDRFGDKKVFLASALIRSSKKETYARLAAR